MIHLYYGDGKGKTTSAMGLALRCAGNGGRVRLFQFLKDNSSCERVALENIKNIELICGRECEKFVFDMTAEEKAEVSEFYVKMLGKLFEDIEQYDMIILDEAGTAVEGGIITEKELIEKIRMHKNDTEIVITGGRVSQELTDVCDYVTHMQKIKHPFDKGVAARKGVEF